MPNLYVLSGLPGSGKSTYANGTFTGQEVIISSDNVIEALASQLDTTYSEIFKDTIEMATKCAEVQLALASYALEDIIVDRTNLSAKSRARVLNLVQKPSEYKKIAIHFATPLELIKLRLQKRNHSGKVISNELLEDMQKRLEVPTVDEGFDEVKVITV